MNEMSTSGQRLRGLREKLGLSLRDVEAASELIAQHRNDPRFVLAIGTLSMIEGKDVVPTLHKLYSLAVIYRRDLGEIWSFFGLGPAQAAAEVVTAKFPKTQIINPTLPPELTMPAKIDPCVDAATTTELTPFIRKWGPVALAHVRQFMQDQYRYGYVGTDDRTMFPLLLPGSFIQVDPERARIARGPWRSEYERQIYLVETRTGYFCSWCELKGRNILLVSHPLSGVETRAFPFEEVGVIGQIVGVAMRLDQLSAAELPQSVTAHTRVRTNA